MDVVGADGEKVGEVAFLHPEGEPTTHLVVRTGLLFVKGYFVPVEAIAAVTDERIVLTVAKDQVEWQGWDAVPD
jgi:hypothetical protein